MSIVPLNFQNIDQKKLHLDCRLVAIGASTSSKTDYVGKRTFDVSFYREGIGFGITNINIETNASLQPLVEIEFKDLYGNTVFGFQKIKLGLAESKSREDNRNINKYKQLEDEYKNIDYSAIFDWPPPKFHFTFKGYLGKPVTWTLNLKKTNTSYNPDDGSFTIKATFVPNQWGFFADMPFLFLHATKKLKEDEYGYVTYDTENNTESNTSAQDAQSKFQTIFDLIQIGKKVQKKIQQTTKEYDELKQKLTSFKFDAVGAIIRGDIEPKETINGEVQGRETIEPPFSNITIKMPWDYENDTKDKIIEKLKEIQGDGKKSRAEHQRILMSSLPGGSDKLKEFKVKLGEIPSTQTGVNTVKNFVKDINAIIDVNLEEIDKEIKRQYFTTNKEEIGRTTISQVFSQLAGDSAFILGNILRAGEIGYLTSKDARDKAVENGEIIGKFFPLTFSDETDKSGEQIPADKDEINIVLNKSKKNTSGNFTRGKEAEMDFVRRFIESVSYGIAENRKSSEDLDMSEQSQLSQRINNLEIASDNPYEKSQFDFLSMANNILARSGIVGFITRSRDPNLPGNYGDTSFIPGLPEFDRDDDEDIKELVDKEINNIKDSYLLNLKKGSTFELDKLKNFCRFFIKLFSEDGESIKKYNGEEFNEISDIDLKDILDYEVVLRGKLSEERTKDQESIKKTKEIINKSKEGKVTITKEQSDILSGVEIKSVGEYLEQFKDVFYKDENNKGNAYIDFSTMKSNLIINNKILYILPSGSGDLFVVFNKTEDKAIIDKASNNSSDSEFVEEEYKDTDEPLGIVKITNINNGNSTLERVSVLNDAIESNRAIDYSKLLGGGGDTDDFLYKKQITQEGVSEGIYYAVYSQGNSDDTVWDIFGNSKESENQRIFLRHLCVKIEEKIENLERETNEAISKALGQAASHENLIYQQMHHIFHQWRILGAFFDANGKEIVDENKILELPKELENNYKKIENDTENNSENGGDNIKLSSFSFQYDFPLQQIDSEVNINVENSIVNIEDLYNPSANMTVLNAIQQICTKNNFIFFPIPGAPLGNSVTKYNDDAIREMFQPQFMPTEMPIISNYFQILFMPTPESRVSTLTDSQRGNKNIKGAVFQVKHGDSGNKIFKSINVSTDENKSTAESIINLQRLVDNENQNKTVTTDCSLLSVMEGRSYKTNIDMIGNAQLSPMMFFYIENMPIFGGLYQIMKTSHSISPNDMSTSIEGMKMRFNGGKYGGIYPVTLETLEGLGNPAKIKQTNINNNINIKKEIEAINKSQKNGGVDYIFNPYFKGEIFTKAYEIDSNQRIVISNPFYFTENGRDANIANVPDNTTIENNIIALQEKLLMPIYKHFGEVPIIINSGYRNKEVNFLVVGKEATSNHTSGLAADITLGTTNSVVQIYNWVIDRWRIDKLPVKELILERKGNSFWVHIAITDSHKFIDWTTYYEKSYANQRFKIYDVKGILVKNSNPESRVGGQFICQSIDNVRKVKERVIINGKDKLYLGGFPGQYEDGTFFGIV